MVGIEFILKKIYFYKMNSKEKVSFKSFVKRFPTVELPIILGNDTHHTFSSNNPPLPALYINTFISLIEGPIEQEFTEIVPCFSIPDTKNFHAIVYWKAGLMDYQYILATYSKQGAPIARRVIGGTFSDCLLYTSPSPRDATLSRMPSSA